LGDRILELEQADMVLKLLGVLALADALRVD
jgi:hypothetical protein